MSRPSRISRGLAEGLVIILSVLVAFWVDASWEARQSRQLESEMIAAVQDEVGLNRRSLEGLVQRNQEFLDHLDWFLAAAPPEISMLPADSVYSYVNSMPSAPVFEPLTTAALLLVERPASSSAGLQARFRAGEFLRRAASLEGNIERLRERSTAVQDLMVAYADQDNTSASQTLSELIAESGAEVLVQMRADDELVQALLLKRHAQAVHRNRLSAGLGPVLDSLASVVGASAR